MHYAVGYHERHLIVSPVDAPAAARTRLLRAAGHRRLPREPPAAAKASRACLLRAALPAARRTVLDAPSSAAPVCRSRAPLPGPRSHQSAAMADARTRVASDAHAAMPPIPVELRVSPCAAASSVSACTESCIYVRV